MDIVGKQIENIEVNGRNPLDMAKLVPGVTFTTGTSYAVGNSGTGANTFSVNGTRPSQNQLSINGIGNVDTGNNGGMNVSVSVDSIAEFISRDSRHFAVLFATNVFSRAARLADFPESGRVVPETHDETVREILFGNYRIIYRVRGREVLVLIIADGRRDMHALLARRLLGA